ncbi:putative germin-like protein 2-3 [Capsicum baccatum]|uniref:Germin-like protein 2-3 n=1 Tax=Capsicum baccatum TaxID=33114 RepID=A0A2G2VWE2_CAPBA|nr:putative germin-like protein 2-3 [Capsicum baccatum]
MQDFCVAIPTSPGIANHGLHLAGNTSNTFGSKVTAVNVAQVPGLNTLGISLARLALHHGELTLRTLIQELLKYSVLEDSLQVGFVTSNPEF